MPGSPASPASVSRSSRWPRTNNGWLSRQIKALEEQLGQLQIDDLGVGRNEDFDVGPQLAECGQARNQPQTGEWNRRQARRAGDAFSGALRRATRIFRAQRNAGQSAYRGAGVYRLAERRGSGRIRGRRGRSRGGEACAEGETQPRRSRVRIAVNGPGLRPVRPDSLVLSMLARECLACERTLQFGKQGRTAHEFNVTGLRRHQRCGAVAPRWW